MSLEFHAHRKYADGVRKFLSVEDLPSRTEVHQIRFIDSTSADMPKEVFGREDNTQVI